MFVRTLFYLVALAIVANGRPCDENPSPTISHHGPSHSSHHHSTSRPTTTHTYSTSHWHPSTTTSMPTPTPTVSQPSSSPSSGGSSNSGGQCNTGPVQCCNSVQPAGGKDASTLLGSLGIVLQDLNVPVGLTCSPILGSGANCAQTPVCCENNNFNGLINIGCSPINIAL
ncbi:Hydrophobin [Abortiporus biennis]